MVPVTRITMLSRPACLCVAALACATVLPGAVAAQRDGDAPAFRLSLSTGVIAQDNRGLDATSQGSTFEYFSRLDFGITFATPIQQLDISGGIGLRHVTGAESDNLDTGLIEPDIALRYARQSRDAALSVDLRYSEIDVSSTSLEDVLGIPDPQLVNEEGARRSIVLDTELELRRRSPFGTTLFAGFTGLSYSDTVSTTLTDQDRFRAGVRFRLDLTPVTQANLSLTYRTFEDFGTAEGVRKTFELEGDLRHDMRNGNASLQFGATNTEEGSRYSLSAGRNISTARWEFGGTLGVTRAVDGDLFPTGSVDLTLTLPNGSVAASFSRSIASGVDDDEKEITSLRMTYDRQLTALTSFNTSLSYSETNPTGAGAPSSVGTLGIGLQHSLTADWQVDMELQHRVSENTAGVRARDNRLSVTLRRDLTTWR